MTMKIKNAIKDTADKLAQQRAELDTVDSKRRQMLREAETEARAKWYDAYGEHRATTALNIEMLESAMARLRDTLADSVEALPYPRGTKLYQWTRRRWSSINSETTLSGTVGKLDVWRSDSARPANQRWGAPNVGEAYVRLLRADGTEGKRWAGLRLGTWCPEGINPNDKQSEV